MFKQKEPAATSSDQRHVARLQSYHQGAARWLVGGLSIGFVLFVYWASTFDIDEVTRASGEVIASSRVQVIQAVDGGVLSSLHVKEGDRVEAGQVLARLDQTRVGASMGETEARLFSLRAKTARLRAEVTGQETPAFPVAVNGPAAEQIRVERALFVQRQAGLIEDMRTLQLGLDLANKEMKLVEKLAGDGDASGSEVLRVQRAANEAESRLLTRRNKFLEDARMELAKAEDEIAQLSQVLTRRTQEHQDTVFTSNGRGIVKNIRMTTVGGVLRAGEEIMQIVPVGDELIIEAKVSPSDIARVHVGLPANIRLDPFDYTIHGSVAGQVVYVSADTLKKETGRGEEIHYRVHVKPSSNPVLSTTGKLLEILPGMTAQVDIRTGERTLMAYLLKPIRKTLSLSLGER
jgi:adhesin transport system membrane fusion protein